MRGEMCSSTARLDNKVAVITGANTGIGRSNTLDFIERGTCAKAYSATAADTSWREKGPSMVKSDKLAPFFGRDRKDLTLL